MSILGNNTWSNRKAVEDALQNGIELPEGVSQTPTFTSVSTGQLVATSTTTSATFSGDVIIGSNKKIKGNGFSGQVEFNQVDNEIMITNGDLQVRLNANTGIVRLYSVGGIELASDNADINLGSLPTSASGLASGALFTQTATQLGGSGTTKVICIVP